VSRKPGVQTRVLVREGVPRWALTVRRGWRKGMKASAGARKRGGGGGGVKQAMRLTSTVYLMLSLACEAGRMS
jgi:hypothetical protein